jgi:hypothetical protein
MNRISGNELYVDSKTLERKALIAAAERFVSIILRNKNLKEPYDFSIVQNEAEDALWQFEDLLNINPGFKIKTCQLNDDVLIEVF